jgi:hypothetical protein
MPTDDAAGPDAPEPGTQEPWDYARFVEIYNRIARERSGWFYEPRDNTAEALGARYHAYPWAFPDLETFAEGLYVWEQNINL